LEKQAEDMDKAMKRLAEQHREKVALCEKQFIQQKHQLKRGSCHFVQLFLIQ
jgi:STE20-like kinase